MEETAKISAANGRKRKLFSWITAVLVFANLFVWLMVADDGTRGLLEVTFFDVGQGDAAFIETPEGAQILIDGGPDAVILEKLANVMPFWDRDIDLVILSHPERDHLTGLFYVLKNYRVEKIAWSEIDSGTAECREWIDSVNNEGAQEIKAVAGLKLNVGKNGASYIDILAPEGNAPASRGSQNEKSVVARLVFGERSFLFPGDASNKGKSFPGNIGGDIASDVLKVSHHGSKYSTDSDFLENVMPLAAVISAGKGNSYGHPNPAVLELLQNYGITITRTDNNGDITFQTNGADLKLKTSK